MTNPDTYATNIMRDMADSDSGLDHVMSAASRACRCIAMPWTPHMRPDSTDQLQLAHLEFSDAASIVADISGDRLTMPRSWYAPLIDAGTITAADIASALRESMSDKIEWLTVEDIKQHPRLPDSPRQQLPTIADLASVPGINDLPGFVSEQITRWSTLHCVHSQDFRRNTGQRESSYSAWRQHACLDDTADKAGICGMKEIVASFPVTAESLLGTAVNQLGLHLPGLANWFNRQLTSINFKAFGADCLPAPTMHSGASEKALLELLAIRVAWDLALYRVLRDKSPLEAVWTEAKMALLVQKPQQQMMAMDCVLQTAFEKSWQRNFIRQLQDNRPPTAQTPAVLQAVFCADPSSEACRRAFEKCSPMIETMGFAGFSGMALHADGAVSATQQAGLAEALLDNIPLHGHFARLVLLVGHATSTVNDLRPADTGCSACDLQDAGAKARLAASILNNAAVRDVLAGRSIVIPADTVFVAALHDSATNRFDLPDHGKVPTAHYAVLEQTRIWLQEISRVVGAETSPSPGLFSNTLRKLLDFGNHKARTLAGRSLAGLAAFIAAPRALTRAINFNGMVCLRSYDWQHDAGYRMLEQIMTAPLLAASCLNLQLYRAAVNNSVNNNALETANRANQQPVRLSVLLAAPIAEIDRIIARHKKVRDLVINDWIHLFAVAPCGQKFLRRFSMGGWTLVRSGPTLAGD